MSDTNDSNGSGGVPSHDSNGRRYSVPRLHGRDEGSPERKASALTPAFALKAIHQWWLVAVPIGLLLAGGAGAAVYFRFQPEYQAEALLQVHSDAFFRERPVSPGELISTQRELAHSRSVLAPVLEKTAQFDGVRDAQDQVAYLAGRLNVVPLGNTGLFKFTFVGSNPQQAAEVVNLVVNSLLLFQSGLDQQRSHDLLTKLDIELQRWQTKMEEDGDRVVALEKQDPLGQKRGSPLDDASRLPLMILMEKRTEIDEKVSMARANVEADKAQIERGAPVPSAEDVELAVRNLPQVLQFEQRIEQQRGILREIERVSPHPENNPTYAVTTQLVKSEEERLEKLKNSLQNEVRSQLGGELLNMLKSQVSAAEAELARLEKTSDFYKQRYDAELAALKKSEGPAFDLEIARWELEQSQDTYQRVQQHLQSVKFAIVAPADVKLLESAAIPTIPVERIPYKNLFLAAMAAFCVPFGLAVLWEYRLRRVSDSKQLEEQSALSVVGEVASFPVRVGRNKLSERAAHGMRLFEESVDSLRTFLVLAQPMRDVQVLAVTSASPREGKTSIASQLAVSIARATNEPTLVIDGDMRRPDIHEIFGIDLGPGLTDLLADETTFDEAVDKSWSDRVHILPAGKLTTSPHRLLGNGEFRKVLDEARQRYRYIVIDTPPVLSAGEALMLSSAADASLVCVMRNYSRVEQVATTYHRLTAAGANVVGSVLSGVPTKQYSKYYGDYGYGRG